MDATVVAQEAEEEVSGLSEVDQEALYHMAEVDGIAFSDLAVLFRLGRASEARAVYESVRERNLRAHGGTATEGGRQIQFRRYDDLFRQSRREFESTKKPKKTVTTKTDASGNVTAVETKVEERDGDPRMLRMALDSAGRIDGLLGLEAPKSMKIDTHSIHDVNINFDAMPMEELERLATIATLRRQGLIVLDQEISQPPRQLQESKTPHQCEEASELSPKDLSEPQTQQQTPLEDADAAA